MYLCYKQINNNKMSANPKNLNSITYIYVLKDPETNLIRYVGKTVNKVNYRLSQHLNEAKRSLAKNHRLNWLKTLIDKNLIPIIEIIDECSWLESQEREQHWIKHYKDSNFDLVNETDGGEGNLGYKKSKDTIGKLKKSLRKKLPKVYQYNLNGTFIKEWECISEASEVLHISSGGIRRNAVGERKKYKDYIWSFSKVEKIEEYNRVKVTPLKGVEHSNLAKLIKQEDLNLTYNNVFVYTLDKTSLIYEGLSLSDVSNYLKTNLNWNQTITTLKNSICQHINSKISYNGLFFSYNPPTSEYVCKSGKLLYLKAFDYETNELLFEEEGLSDFCDKHNLNKTNVINNIKGKTKTMIYGNVKIKVEYCPINEKSLI